MIDKLGDSEAEQDALRAAASWAVDHAERALPVFESRHPGDARPRSAIDAARQYGKGKRRDQALRVLALAAFRASSDADEPSRHAARAASLAAAVAYTHTDLQTGQQGIRQARHILGPAVHAALAIEGASGDEPTAGDDFIRRASQSAPPDVRHILGHMPPQPEGKTRLDGLFASLDAALRVEE